MKLSELKIKNFRNHTSFETEFNDGVTIITGDNGSGKSTILEAIHILSTGRTKMSKYDKDLIQYNKSFCTVRANIQTQEDEFNMELQIERSDKFENASIKRAKINKVQKSMQYFTGVFNSVLFTPQDIQLITGSPSERRKYIDDMISQVDIFYKRKLNEYIKATRQRNKLLEGINKGTGGWDQINFYTNIILENGIEIQEKREQMFKDIKQILLENGKLLNNEETKLEIKYLKNEINKERLEEYKSREIAAMTTLIGPHRDDFEIYFNNHNVSEFGSRGEKRSCVLSLKLAEIEYIEKIKKDKPVLLLDDIFSELDDKHQKAVLKTIDNKQTIVTCTSTPIFIKEKKLKIISLKKE